MRYLLDTNIVSDLVPHGRITERIRKVGEMQICTSIIVAAELRYGAEKKGSPRLTAQLAAVLGALDVLPFDAPADRTNARRRPAMFWADYLPSVLLSGSSSGGTCEGSLAGAEGFEFTPLNSKSHRTKALPAKSRTKW